MKAKLIRQGVMDSSYFTKNQQIKPKQVEISDPSLKKMKEEIQQRENKN